MAENVEIKARIDDFPGLTAGVEKICGKPGALLVQKDTYYKCGSARLKLREGNGTAELIFYRREDHAGPKKSRYRRLPVRFPRPAHALLGFFLGVRGVVKKRRTLFFFENTRIHLDQVEDLGTFLEFEVVLEGNAGQKEGALAAAYLMELFHIRAEDLVSGSYIDLFEAGQARGGVFHT